MVHLKNDWWQNLAPGPCSPILMALPPSMSGGEALSRWQMVNILVVLIKSAVFLLPESVRAVGELLKNPSHHFNMWLAKQARAANVSVSTAGLFLTLHLLSHFFFCNPTFRLLRGKNCNENSRGAFGTKGCGVKSVNTNERLDCGSCLLHRNSPNYIAEREKSWRTGNHLNPFIVTHSHFTRRVNCYA